MIPKYKEFPPPFYFIVLRGKFLDENGKWTQVLADSAIFEDKSEAEAIAKEYNAFVDMISSESFKEHTLH